jgi:hypothetical protein
MRKITILLNILAIIVIIILIIDDAAPPSADAWPLLIFFIAPIFSILAVWDKKLDGEDSTLELVRKVIRAKLKKAALD